MSDKLTKKEVMEIHCQDFKRFSERGLVFLDEGKLISASKQFNEISKTAEMLWRTLQENG